MNINYIIADLTHITKQKIFLLKQILKNLFLHELKYFKFVFIQLANSYAQFARITNFFYNRILAFLRKIRIYNFFLILLAISILAVIYPELIHSIIPSTEPQSNIIKFIDRLSSEQLRRSPRNYKEISVTMIIDKFNINSYQVSIRVLASEKNFTYDKEIIGQQVVITKHESVSKNEEVISLTDEDYQIRYQLSKEIEQLEMNTIFKKRQYFPFEYFTKDIYLKLKNNPEYEFNVNIYYLDSDYLLKIVSKDQNCLSISLYKDNMRIIISLSPYLFAIFFSFLIYYLYINLKRHLKLRNNLAEYIFSCIIYYLSVIQMRFAWGSIPKGFVALDIAYVLSLMFVFYSIMNYFRDCNLEIQNDDI